MMTKTMDSRDFKKDFYGILNNRGDLWTPLAFDSVGAAERHLKAFWGGSSLLLPEFKIVPVRIRLEVIEEADQ